MRVGTYRITAELQGFTTVNRGGVDVLVGQTAVVNLQLAPSSVAETVTVTAERRCSKPRPRSLGGNVDPRQVQELPVNGRNWMALALLAPGSRTSSTNAITPLPDRNGGEAREFQLNVDGQQVSADIGTGGQPKYSQDSIAEFQFISNRFDATMGRSTGVQVNAVTKSGSNQFSGLFRGNFRNSRFNAENPVLHLVEPIDNQQLSTTVGGPIVQNKLHYFANYEYEREPRTSIWNTPYPSFNVQLAGINNQKKGGVRLDYQLSTKTRVMGKISSGRLYEPFGLGNQQHPAATGTNEEYNDEYLGRAHAGSEQPGAERDLSGEGRVRPRQRQPHDVVEALAGGQRHHDRVAPHHVHELHDCRQPVLSAAPGPVGLERPRQLHVLVRRGRPSRPAPRRRVPASSSDSGELPPVHGDD